MGYDAAFGLYHNFCENLTFADTLIWFLRRCIEKTRKMKMKSLRIALLTVNEGCPPSYPPPPGPPIKPVPLRGEVSM